MLIIRGLDTEILRIQWSPGIIPAKIQNFETVARRERYRILARAAIHNKISNLYLGHHQDDQVETFLMRLTGSEGGARIPPSTALLGMEKCASIPCCEDIYGAFEDDSSSGHPDDGTVSLTHYGLTMMRPFLHYSKARLQATCEEMAVECVTDETNLEPTSTRRNAIRHLLTTHKLPRALQRSSLVRSHVRIREKVWNCLEVHRTALWWQLKVQKFDVRSGSLSIEFPERSKLGSEEQCFTSIAYMMIQLLDAVSPKPRGSISVSADIIDSVIGVLFQGTSEHQMSRTRSVKTVAGVLIEPSQRLLRLSREPIRSIERSELVRTFIAAPQAGSSEGPLWTQWLFWDYRYWLRIKLGPSEHADEYAVRAYTEADVVSVLSRLRMISSKAVQEFQNLIESAAKGRTKFTLPVITREGLVISFPTLNISLPGPTGHNWEDRGLPGKPWQMRYKSQTRQFLIACLRGGINPMKIGGYATGDEVNLLNAEWKFVPELEKLRHTERVGRQRELRWLETLQYDMPAAEFERHCLRIRERSRISRILKALNKAHPRSSTVFR